MSHLTTILHQHHTEELTKIHEQISSLSSTLTKDLPQEVSSTLIHIASTHKSSHKRKTLTVPTTKADHKTPTKAPTKRRKTKHSTTTPNNNQDFRNQPHRPHHKKQPHTNTPTPPLRNHHAHPKPNTAPTHTPPTQYHSTAIQHGTTPTQHQTTPDQQPKTTIFKHTTCTSHPTPTSGDTNTVPYYLQHVHERQADKQIKDYTNNNLVVNLTQHQLEKPLKSILSKGLKFIPTPSNTHKQTIVDSFKRFRRSMYTHYHFRHFSNKHPNPFKTNSSWTPPPPDNPNLLSYIISVAASIQHTFKQHTHTGQPQNSNLNTEEIEFLK